MSRKRLAEWVLVLTLGIAIGGGWHALAARADGRGGAALQNGDVNGDDRIDLSDAVYTLTWLFSGGSAPVDMDCAPPTAGAGLPDTGQTLCYDGAGRRILCTSPTCPGQDGARDTGTLCPAEGRFADNGDGTVTDYCTGLMWQKDTADINEDGAISPQFDRVTWCEALEHCEGLTHAGYDDWRLPNIRELLSLVDYGRVNPAIDPTFSAASWGYWSSTTFTGFPDYAWSVIFDDGDDWGEVKGKLFGHVRAVRND